MSFTPSFYNVHCSNCRRHGHGINLTQCSLEDIDKLKQKTQMIYNCIPRGSTSVFLCSHCNNFLLSRSKQKPRYCDYWPAMIYAFLSSTPNANLVAPNLNERWKCLPETWRKWWRHVFVEQLMEEDPLFIDLSTELEELKNGIKQLEWINLARLLDEHLAYPEVRCPWGCSEFLNQVKFVPLEDFLWYYSGYTFKIRNTICGKLWTDGINPSYPSACLILEKFPCRPSMVLNDDGPMLLCCRRHSTNTKEAYLHVPESPTGTIHSPYSNQYTPAIIKSRTLRNSKMNCKSDTYSTNILQGGYDGFDTSYISSSGRYRRSDALSSLRDALSISGRDDIRGFVRTLSSDVFAENYLPERYVKEKIEHAHQAYPDPQNLPQVSAATCIPISDAITMQEDTYGQTSSSIMVHSERETFGDDNDDSDDSDGSDDSDDSDDDVPNVPKATLFEPPWPKKLVFVHPTDGYGKRFPRLHDTDFGLWMLSAITTTVPEIWQSVSSAVKDNCSWHGHWLKHASKMAGLPRSCVVHKNARHIFKNRKISEIPMVFKPSAYKQLSNHIIASEMFKDCGGIDVVNLDLTMHSSTVVIRKECIAILAVASNLFRQTSHAGPGQPLHQQILPADASFLTSAFVDDGFELRTAVFGLKSSFQSENWKVYSRHARHPHFWVQNGQQGNFCKAREMSISVKDLRTLRLAVYCKKRKLRTETLRRRYMKCLGGQDAVYCERHNALLIVNHRKAERLYSCPCSKEIDPCSPNIAENGSLQWKNQTQSGCDDPVTHVCPFYRTCRTGICETHLKMICTPCINSVDKVVLLSPRSAKYVSIGGTECPFDQKEDCPPVDVVHGPVEPMELATDLYPQDSDGSSVSSNGSQNTSASVDDLFHTNSGFETMEVEVDTGKTTSSTPLCVLLNRQGHLLTRYGSKLRMKKRHQAFYQKIVATSTGRSIPMVYSEAMLFPDIFWCGMQDGTILGAFPTALLTDKKALGRLGIASIAEHAIARITNPANLCSTNPRYHYFQFDELVNIGLRGKDSRIVLHRGFADSQGEDGVRFRESSDCDELYGETSENHANVHKLSAMVGARPAHYFLTFSCNQETCMGLKVIREWVTSLEAQDIISKKYNLEPEEASKYLRESAAPYILRSWNEVIDIWMRYIIHSEDAPLHHIEYCWYRKEFQGTP